MDRQVPRTSGSIWGQDQGPRVSRSSSRLQETSPTSAPPTAPSEDNSAMPPSKSTESPLVAYNTLHVCVCLCVSVGVTVCLCLSFCMHEHPTVRLPVRLFGCLSIV